MASKARRLVLSGFGCLSELQLTNGCLAPQRPSISPIDSTLNQTHVPCGRTMHRQDFGCYAVQDNQYCINSRLAIAHHNTMATRT